MTGITIFISTTVKESEKQFGFLNQNRLSCFGSYTLIDGLIDTENKITPFNLIEDEIIYLGSQEDMRYHLSALMIELILHMLYMKYSYFKGNVRIFATDKGSIQSYKEKADKLTKDYGYLNLDFQYIPQEKNKFCEDMLKSPILLTSYEGEKVSSKVSTLLSRVGTVKNSKAKRIEELAMENTELKLKLQQAVDVAYYYRSKERKISA